MGCRSVLPAKDDIAYIKGGNAGGVENSYFKEKKTGIRTMSVPSPG